MFSPVTRWLAFATIALVALALRTWNLGARPMHADEANQAVKTGALLDGARYTFDPHDHHGPTLYFATLPIAWVRGEHSLAALTETTVRLGPALFGTASVLLLGALVWSMVPGAARADRAFPAPPAAALLAAAFLALSPPAVYYARYFIQETLLVTFTLAAAFAARRWWTTGRASWAVATGVSAGLMLATKESALVFMLAAGIAAAAARPPRPRSGRPVRDALLAVGSALAVAALLYASFGLSPGGLRDALLAPWLGLERAAGGSGHEKPWWYYLQLLTWQRSGGLVWHQVAFTALAVVGAVVGLRIRSGSLRAAAVYAILVLIGLSAVPYKTPWNVIHVLPPLAALAAAGIMAMARRRAGPFIAGGVAAVTLALLANQTRWVAFLRSADARNPYAYVHSSPDVRKYRALVKAALAARPSEPVRIISEEYWPLPWYLRGLPRIGYWTTPPAACDGALVITSADLADAVRARLQGRYRQRFLGLRPGFVCIVFTPEGQP